MVKTVKLVSVFFLAVVLCVNGGRADEPTTTDAVKGKDLTTEVAKTLPHRDCSTLQKAFLGFLRSNAEGNLRDYLFYLTPQARKAVAGVDDESAISDDKARAFETAFKGAGFRKFILESFQAFPDASPTQIVAVVSSSRGKMVGREKYDIGVIQTNGLWKFTTVNVSTIERKATEK